MKHETCSTIIRNKRTKIGFSLIEVLVFASILSTFIVFAIAVTTVSLRNMKINEHKILATRYSEELMDWLRGQKETDFNSFASARASSGGITWCFNSTPISAWPSLSGACGAAFDGLVPAIYKRQVVLKSNGSPSVVSVTVSIQAQWNEPTGLHTVPLVGQFSILE